MSMRAMHTIRIRGGAQWDAGRHSEGDAHLVDEFDCVECGAKWKMRFRARNYAKDKSTHIRP